MRHSRFTVGGLFFFSFFFPLELSAVRLEDILVRSIALSINSTGASAGRASLSQATAPSPTRTAIHNKQTKAKGYAPCTLVCTFLPKASSRSSNVIARMQAGATELQLISIHKRTTCASTSRSLARCVMESGKQPKTVQFCLQGVRERILLDPAERRTPPSLVNFFDFCPHRL